MKMYHILPSEYFLFNHDLKHSFKQLKENITLSSNVFEGIVEVFNAGAPIVIRNPTYKVKFVYWNPISSKMELDDIENFVPYDQYLISEYKKKNYPYNSPDFKEILQGTKYLNYL